MLSLSNAGSLFWSTVAVAAELGRSRRRSLRVNYAAEKLGFGIPMPVNNQEYLLWKKGQERDTSEA
jgi:hypothetical protein